MIIFNTGSYTELFTGSHFRRYLKSIGLSMRQIHLAGEKIFVDFAGRTISYHDKETGQKRKAYLFIAVLGCSKYTFVFAVDSQSTRNFIDAHNHMFWFFGGAPLIIIPDNLKAAVITAGPSPKYNRTYLEMANHYSAAIVAARPRKPKDKALAENDVRLVYRWILVKLRKIQFFSVAEINNEISAHLVDFNGRPLRTLNESRRERFEKLDKPALKPLPKEPFEFAEWTSPLKVGPDYHIAVEKHYYSVPCNLVGERVEARVTAKVVEIYFRHKRVASHMRSEEVGGATTTPEHQPSTHRWYAAQTPDNMLAWAGTIGPETTSVVQAQIDNHPSYLAIKNCANIRKLLKHYRSEQLEAACKRANQIHSHSYSSIKSIMKHGLELSTNTPVQLSLPLHKNVRGASYYRNFNGGNRDV